MSKHCSLNDLIMKLKTYKSDKLFFKQKSILYSNYKMLYASNAGKNHKKYKLSKVNYEHQFDISLANIL